jgi:cytochrome c oxidase assembly protein subunit 15
MAEGRLLAPLATVTAVATWLLVVLGGVVRVTESGMGCPDWPTCFGALAPPAGLAETARWPAWIEMGHRYAAAGVALLVLATAVLAWRGHQSGAGAPWRAAALGVGLVAAQVLMGAVTVWTANAPWTVSAHLALALALVATTAITALLARRPGPARLGAAGASLLGLTAALALVGSVVQTTGGGFLCPDLPFCHGQAWPGALGLPAEAHMLHRALALATGLALLATAAPAWRAGGSTRRWALVAGALFALQALVGLAQVSWGMPATLRGAHLAAGAAFWLAAVALTLRLGQATAAPGRIGSAAPAPVLHGSRP